MKELFWELLLYYHPDCGLLFSWQILSAGILQKPSQLNIQPTLSNFQSTSLQNHFFCYTDSQG